MGGQLSPHFQNRGAAPALTLMILCGTLIHRAIHKRNGKFRKLEVSELRHLYATDTILHTRIGPIVSYCRMIYLVIYLVQPHWQVSNQ